MLHFPHFSFIIRVHVVTLIFLLGEEGGGRERGKGRREKGRKGEGM